MLTGSELQGILVADAVDLEPVSLQFWELQGDFDKMQGGRNRDLAISCRNSIGWIALSLREEQGRLSMRAGRRSALKRYEMSE
jgi:hypothetical protein